MGERTPEQLQSQEDLLREEIARIENFSPDEPELERTSMLLALLEELQKEDIRGTLVGGYGLDALYGKLTRNHKDADILFRAEDREKIKQVCERLGFILESEKLGKKDSYIHPSNPEFEIEVVFDSLLKNRGESNLDDFVPDSPNGRLLDMEVSAMPLAGQKRAITIQNQRASEEGWGEYPSEKEINRQALMVLLSQKGS